MTSLTPFENYYMKYGIRPTKLGVLGFLIIYLWFIPLDYVAFPTNFTLFLLIRTGIVIFNLSIFLILEKRGLLKKYLLQLLIIVYSTGLIGIWVMLLLSDVGASGREFYLYYVPMMMIAFSAFYYRNFIGIVIICVLSILVSFVIALTTLRLSFEQLSAHTLLFTVGSFFSLMYNYWVKKVRTTIINTNIRLEEQKENLRVRIQRSGERNKLLAKQKEVLDTKLKYFGEQLPQSLQVEVLDLFQKKGLIQEEMDWQEQVFSKRQIQVLTEKFHLKKDQILLLSGVYLSLSYTEIRESLFPHISIRSVENMASALRKTLSLPRGANLVKFIDSI